MERGSLREPIDHQEKKRSESGLTEESNRTKAVFVLWKRHAV